MWSARAHEVKNVFKCETHFHKWRKVEGMKPNDSQMHSHFGSCIRVGIMNVQSLGWKSKQAPNWAPMTPLERSWSIDASNTLTLFIYIWFAWVMIKERGKSQIGNLTCDHKSLESKGQMKFDWSMLYAVGNIFLKL